MVTIMLSVIIAANGQKTLWIKGFTGTSHFLTLNYTIPLGELNVDAANNAVFMLTAHNVSDTNALVFAGDTFTNPLYTKLLKMIQMEMSYGALMLLMAGLFTLMTASIFIL